MLERVLWRRLKRRVDDTKYRTEKTNTELEILMKNTDMKRKEMKDIKRKELK